MAEIYEPRRVQRYRGGNVESSDDLIVSEVPVTIMLNDVELATLVCSPYAYRELVIGFLRSEGLIVNKEDIQGIDVRQEQGVIWVQTTRAVPAVDNFLRRNFSSCCGKSRPSLYFINDSHQLSPIETRERFSAKRLLELIAEMEKGAETFQKTGGVHTAGLADRNGIVIRYEDIGRHNALDRVLGYSMDHGIEPSDKMILLSGRVASEMLLKTARMGAPVLVSRSAPTALALDLAEELGITVVGFVRGDRLTVYTHPDRVDLSE
ncbi:MAG: formate dehydrogenase accessory sulfurtransferase FdhD [Solirubrobacterales bacterium]